MPREQFNRKISPLIEDRLPDFVRGEFTTFQSFVEAYYKWMEQEGMPVERTGTLLSQRDVDESDTEFLDYIQNEYLQSFPSNMEADKRLVIKNIKTYQKEKGTPQAFKFLFRILYDIDTVNVEMPWQKVTQLSAGEWQLDKTIKLSFDGFPIEEWQKAIGQIVKQRNTNATAILDAVKIRYYAGTQFVEIYLHEINPDHPFVSSERVYVEFVEDGITKNVSGKPLFNAVDSVTVVSGGSGYQVGEQLVFIPECTGVGAKAFVETVDADGAIKTLKLFETGYNYQTAPTVTVTSSGGSGANITATVGVIGTYPGYYLNDTGGFLSNDSVVQDSYYWQKFSYVLETNTTDNISFKDYEAAVRGAGHPAGMKMFGRVLIEETQDASQESDTITTAVTSTVIAGISSSSSS